MEISNLSHWKFLLKMRIPFLQTIALNQMDLLIKYFTATKSSLHTETDERNSSMILGPKNYFQRFGVGGSSKR